MSCLEYSWNVISRAKLARATLSAACHVIPPGTCVAAWHCRDAYFPSEMRRNAWGNVYQHDEPKKRAIFDEQRDTYFLRAWCNFWAVLRSKIASRFSSRMDTKLRRNVEGGHWSMLMKVAFPNHALGARKSRKTTEFSASRSRNFGDSSIPDVRQTLLPCHEIPQIYIRTSKDVLNNAGVVHGALLAWWLRYEDEPAKTNIWKSWTNMNSLKDSPTKRTSSWT